jgi:hypothetical protein
MGERGTVIVVSEDRPVQKGAANMRLELSDSEAEVVDDILGRGQSGRR